ncbi:hypothetical protein AAHB50_30925 [Bacillus toyonensis]
MRGNSACFCTITFGMGKIPTRDRKEPSACEASPLASILSPSAWEANPLAIVREPSACDAMPLASILSPSA